MAQVALAWTSGKDGLLLTHYSSGCMAHVQLDQKTFMLTGVTAPIVGTTSIENLMDLISAFLLSFPHLLLVLACSMTELTVYNRVFAT